MKTDPIQDSVTAVAVTVTALERAVDEIDGAVNSLTRQDINGRLTILLERLRRIKISMSK